MAGEVSCFSYCDEDDMRKATDNGGAYMMKNPAGNEGSHHASGNVPKGGQAAKVRPIEVPLIQVEELKEITDNFGTNALIGEGSYGRLYYGVLKSREHAAIKKLDATKQPDEVSMVSRLKHDNFVQLLGYCFEGNSRVLAHEFASNGSVHNILHDGTYLANDCKFITPSPSHRKNMFLHSRIHAELLHACTFDTSSQAELDERRIGIEIHKLGNSPVGPGRAFSISCLRL